jgi:hypothetical protein
MAEDGIDYNNIYLELNCQLTFCPRWIIVDI